MHQKRAFLQYPHQCKARASDSFELMPQVSPICGKRFVIRWALSLVACNLLSLRDPLQQRSPLTTTEATMTKSMKSLTSIAVTLMGIAGSACAESDHTVAGKVTLISEYEYRGISQTHQKPAVQLNLDYSHKSGFYAGAFLTNISWIKETQKFAQQIAVIDRFNNGGGIPPTPTGKGSVELDLFAGYKAELTKGLTLDVGYLRYEYPGSQGVKYMINSRDVVFLKKPNTDEIYLGLNFGDFGAKYSHQVSNSFGAPDSKNSYFAELNWSKEVVDKLTVAAHIGRAKFKNYGPSDYTVYRLGATYDLSGWLLGAYVKGTNGNANVYTYNGKDWSKDRLVVSVARAF
jgi:uncharacterized protein (TIGR02001 family)